MKKQFSIIFLLLLFISLNIFGYIIVKTNYESSMTIKAWGYFNGIENLKGNPLGFGIGYGGNLGNNDRLSEYGIYYKKDYERVLNGSESSIGVFLTQIGIFGLIYIIFVISTGLKNIVNAYDSNNHKLLDFAMIFLIIVFVSLYQEESFGSYALGLISFFMGYEKYKNEKSNNTY